VSQTAMMLRRSMFLLALICGCSCGEHDLTRSRGGLLVSPGGVVLPERDIAQTDEDSIKYRMSLSVWRSHHGKLSRRTGTMAYQTVIAKAGHVIPRPMVV